MNLIKRNRVKSREIETIKTYLELLFRTFLMSLNESIDAFCVLES